jgi:hypothetical protein
MNASKNRCEQYAFMNTSLSVHPARIDCFRPTDAINYGMMDPADRNRTGSERGLTIRWALNGTISASVFGVPWFVYRTYSEYRRPSTILFYVQVMF